MSRLSDAKGLLNSKQGKALLDVIAYSEGTSNISSNGYDVMQSFYKLVGWTENTTQVHEGFKWQDLIKSRTSAFGRYQFLEETWKELSTKLLGLDNAPVTNTNQDILAAHLIRSRYGGVSFTKGKRAGIVLPAAPPLNSINRNNFHKVLDILSTRWSSIPNTKIYKGGSFFGGNERTRDSVNQLFNVYSEALKLYK